MSTIDAIEKAHCVAGIITNSVLLYCIRRHTRISLGAYKHLLTLFASYDLYLTILHLVIEPEILIVEAVFGVISKSFYASRELISFYCACFTVPFILMNIHFLYRYWTVQRPHLIPLFSKTPFISFLAMLPVGGCALWYIICIYALTGKEYDGAGEILRAAFKKQHGMNVTQGWIVMDWRAASANPSPLPSLIVFVTVIIVSLLLATTLGSLTYAGIREQIKMSRSKHHMQLRLLVAVSAQTFIPFICVYIPYFCCLTFVPLHIPATTMADLCFFLIACFPAWDAVIVILLMTDYRRAIGDMLPRLKPPPVAISQITFTTRYP